MYFLAHNYLYAPESQVTVVAHFGQAGYSLRVGIGFQPIYPNSQTYLTKNDAAKAARYLCLFIGRHKHPVGLNVQKASATAQPCSVTAYRFFTAPGAYRIEAIVGPEPVEFV